MSSRDKDLLGRAGERRAALHYLLRGWRIAGRNVRDYGGEIDLIVRRGRVVAFVEVKTRRESDAGAPWESVRDGQRRRIMRAAEGWLAAHPAGDDTEVRFDIVSIVKTRWRFRIERFEGAFEAEAEGGVPWRRR